MKKNSQRPKTLAQVAGGSESLEEFGLSLRDWIHAITRGDVSSRPALASAICEEPRFLYEQFEGGAVADAFLAAYAEWIADQAKIERPEWTRSQRRVLVEPWFANNARAALLVDTPASFRQRGVFTIPEPVVKLRRGRPRVSQEQKRAKARLRDQRYRAKQRQWIKAGKAVMGN